MTNKLITILCCLLLVNSSQGAGIKSKYRLKPDGLGKWTAFAIAFSPNGELYVVHDSSETKDTVSSRLVIQVYDGATGEPKRQADIPTVDVPRPRWFKTLEISSDGNLALFVDEPGWAFLERVPGETRFGTFDTKSLSLLSTAILPDVRMEDSEVFGFSHNSKTVLVASGHVEADDKLNLGYVTSHVRLTELDPTDLSRTVRENIAENPFPGSGFHVDSWGDVWFYDANRNFPASLHRLERRDGRVNVVRPGDDPRFAAVLFLPRAVLGFMHTGHPEYSGVVARYEPSVDKAPVATYRAIDCQFRERTTLSSDARVAAAVCTASGSRFIPDTGSKTIVARAIVLDTKTLQPLAAIPLSRKRHERRWLAVSHREGRTLVATLDASQRVSVYEFAGP